TAFGYQALKKGTLNYTSAFGAHALTNATGLSLGCSAFGAKTLEANTTGLYNNAFGYMALAKNTTGSNNSAFGTYALSEITTGTQNTAIGTYALSSNLTGSYNSGLGYGSCRYVTGSNKTCIGYNSGPTADAPDATTTTEVIYLGRSSTTSIVSGVPEISVYSDKRLKDVKDEYKKGLEQIRGIVPKFFVYKNDESKTLKLGVIAQELQKVLPEAVEKNGDGYLVVRQEYIKYALVNAVKQIDKVIQNLIAEVKTLVAKVNFHDHRIKKLEQENAELRARLEKLEKVLF
ncbi:tail fiber domain-containing protein, partial [bacterium]|nr:tail fiber domain-containing protein [bacterium]